VVASSSPLAFTRSAWRQSAKCSPLRTGFDNFTEDNDPWGEHDCAILTVNGHRALFKIDYFDLELQYHSPDASDPAITQRVMTVLLAEEY
jgi:hypothetical protein